MLLDSPTLLIAAAAGVAIASAAAASIGVRQKLRRGVWWWIGANTALAAALVCHAMSHDDNILAPLAALLALQWPIVTLAGLRRFFARGGASVPARADWLVLGVVTLVSVGAWFVPLAEITPQQVLSF